MKWLRNTKCLAEHHTTVLLLFTYKFYLNINLSSLNCTYITIITFYIYISILPAWNYSTVSGFKRSALVLRLSLKWIGRGVNKFNIFKSYT